MRNAVMTEKGLPPKQKRWQTAAHIEVDMDTTDIVDDVVSQIETTLGIQHQNMITVNMNNRLNEIEKKMDLILKHLGITPENV